MIVRVDRCDLQTTKSKDEAQIDLLYRRQLQLPDHSQRKKNDDDVKNAVGYFFCQ